MEEKIASILNEMSEHLSVSQTKKLQEVMLRVFSDRELEKKSHSNSEFLSLFLEAKRVEGCSIKNLIPIQNFYPCFLKQSGLKGVQSAP